MGIESIYNEYLKSPSVQTDTRKLQKGDIFFALKGPNFNGNHFVKQALDEGASLVICDDYQFKGEEKVIVVEDALITLQQLAAHHRNQFSIPFIAITGSNGKTTTKELMHAVLSTVFKTYTTFGNLNNHIGVPLTILKIRNDAEIAIIEMGANHLGEIASYCAYTRPTHAVITNIGKAHLEGFGGAENVKIAKGELFEYVQKIKGTAFVNAEDPNVVALSEPLQNKIYYGASGKDVAGNGLENEYFLQVDISHPAQFSIDTQLVGTYNISNVLAAVCAGLYFGLPVHKIKQAIESYSPSNSRSQLVRMGDNEIILDAYNANPGSMKAAIENFAALKGSNKMLLLGDMKELGADTEAEHQAIIDLIQKYKWADVVLAGASFGMLNHPFKQFNNATEAANWFRNSNIQGYQILVKGSRSMTMEKVIQVDS